MQLKIEPPQGSKNCPDGGFLRFGGKEGAVDRVAAMAAKMVLSLFGVFRLQAAGLQAIYAQPLAAGRFMALPQLISFSD